jgi:hypothetical protein
VQKTRLDRFVLSHFLAYPVAMPWAVAAIPPAIWLYADELMRELDEAQMSKAILRLTLAPTLVAFALAHGVAIPWVTDDTAPWRRRLFVYGASALAALGVVAAAVGWTILLTAQST